MTALIFQITPDEVVFATDTLALSGPDRTPFTYLTKFVVLPHVRIAATGTGNGDLLAEWFGYLRGGYILARDIDGLDQYCPPALRKLAQTHDLRVLTATAYHFGYSPRSGRFLARVYRSTNDFRSEEILDALAVKPDVQITEPLTGPESIIGLMERQRADDLARAPADRIGIGGEIQCVHMKQESTSVFTLHRFGSYEDDYDTMCENIG